MAPGSGGKQSGPAQRQRRSWRRFGAKRPVKDASVSTSGRESVNPITRLAKSRRKKVPRRACWIPT